MNRLFANAALLGALLGLFSAAWAPSIAGQDVPVDPVVLDRVLVSQRYQHGSAALPADQGASGLWHRLLKLTTTASVLHTTAHPDDEHADMLTQWSRRGGVRTALLALNRGEGGANAIGPELFDGVGLIRTEELLLAGRYYGLDDQYFTTAVDYGYSKTLDEAYRSWSREAVLEDMVRVIRLNRPFVVVSRFHGSPRDGHGHHQAAGDLTPQAVRAAGDPSRFPEQITREGLRPWQPRKLYRGGVAPDEFHHLEVDGGEYSPWLGASFAQFAAYGLSLQRSQTSGRVREVSPPPIRRYERLPTTPEDSVGAITEGDWFDGLDTSLSGLFDLTGETPEEGAHGAVSLAQQSVEAALAAFDPGAPTETIPSLAGALEAVREAIALSVNAPEAAFVLAIKERQIEAAMAAAANVRIAAVAIDPDDAGSGGFAPPTLGPVVAAQGLMVWSTVTAAGTRLDGPPDVRLVSDGDWRGTDAQTALAADSSSARASRYQVRHLIALPGLLEATRPPFFRTSLRENVYQIRDSTTLHMPWANPPLYAEATVQLGGQSLRIRDAVRTRESDLPYGTVLRELTVVPRLSVRVEPRALIAPLGTSGGSGATGLPGTGEPVEVRVEIEHNALTPSQGTLRLDRPQGWPIEPGVYDLDFDGPGQRRTYTFRVFPRDLEDVAYPLVAVASASGQSHREGYDVIRHRDLETRRLYTSSQARLIGIDLSVAPDLRVGYVMGVGDEVPAAIAQLGASVTLLDDEELASLDLTGFDAILVGTRAYAVRPTLYAQGPRLLQYAEAGGHLVVLYQTQEFVPDRAAPYPAQLPRGAEEVSEEDAAVRLLDPDHVLLRAPNRITEADFDGWIEQRGSKFFTQWDSAYSALVETHDTDQEDQRGIWLTAPVGAGRYTYCALALHRQLPSGVSGAYRILANLISATRQ